MELDHQILFNIAISLGIAVGGWFFRQLWDAVKTLKTDITAIEKELSKDLSSLEKGLPIAYVRRDEFMEVLHDIKDMFNKINDKLDDKVDK